MPMIQVRAKPGRAVNTTPTGGERIPEDRFITVRDSDWLRRLASKHGDIEVRPAKDRQHQAVRRPAERPADKASPKADGK